MQESRDLGGQPRARRGVAVAGGSAAASPAVQCPPGLLAISPGAGSYVAEPQRVGDIWRRDEDSSLEGRRGGSAAVSCCLPSTSQQLPVSAKMCH